MKREELHNKPKIILPPIMIVIKNDGSITYGVHAGDDEKHLFLVDETISFQDIARAKYLNAKEITDFLRKGAQPKRKR